MNETDEKTRRITSAQWGVVALVVACAAGSILYKVLIHERLGHSAAMFIGIPAVLAILLALAPNTRSITGGIVKGITIALLMVAPMLGEGYLCILIASPLFYAVGILIGAIVDASRRRRNTTLSCVAVFLLPLCLEGVVPELTFQRAQTVEVTKVVNTPALLVEQALAKSPNLSVALPAVLQIGFPKPMQALGDGLFPGATRTVHFSGAEGDPPGDLVMRVSERRKGYLRMERISDDSKLTQWLQWNQSEIEWRPVDEFHTRVTWRIGYDRELDPAWYFAPWERLVVGHAAGYLIDSNATPTRQQ